MLRLSGLRRAWIAAAAAALAACGVVDPPGAVEAPEASDQRLPDVAASPELPSGDAGEPGADGTDDGPGAEEGDLEPSGPPAAPEPAGAYEPSDAETHPQLKRLAAEAAQTLTTYEVGDRPRVVARRLVDDEDAVAKLAVALLPVHHEDAWSRGEVLYPQFGGLADDASSQMVVVRQTVGLPDGSTSEEVRTLDVRLRRDEDGWRFDELASAGGEPVPRPDDLTEPATTVLDDDRIELPDSARWDIHRGAVEPTLLTLMTRLADEVGDFGVVVFETGHPYHVFGTDKKSDHLRGRAVDVHRIGDRLVVEDREEGGDLHAVVRWLYEDPIRPIIGSPWALDAFGGRSFTDAVHRDHLHIAVPAPDDRDDVADPELADDE